MPLAVRDVGLARLDTREHVDQPGAALLELGGRLRERRSTRVELLGTRFEPREARFVVAHVTRAPRQLGLLLRELCRALADATLAGHEARGRLVELFLPGSGRALALVNRGYARRERSLQASEPLTLGLELCHASLELGRARVELPQSRRLHALLLGDLRGALRDLCLLCRHCLRSPLLRLERRARGRDPLATLLELGRQHAQLARADVQFACAFA